jgi:hypothetical protein
MMVMMLNVIGKMMLISKRKATEGKNHANDSLETTAIIDGDKELTELNKM